MTRSRTPPRSRSTVLRDLVVVGLLAIFSFLVAARFELAERLRAWSARHERLDVDELTIVLVTLVLGLVVFALLRSLERRRESADREAIENRYQELVERVPAVTYVWDTRDRVGGVSAAFVSPQIERVLGYSVAEWQADPEIWLKTVHPDDRDRVMAEWNEAVARGGTFKVEYRMHRKDGAMVWIRDEAVPVISGTNGGAGAGTLLQGVMVDVTDQKTIEVRLRETEARYRGFVEQIPSVTYLEPIEGGRLLYVSPQIEQMLGFTQEEYLDLSVWEASLHPDDRDHVLELDRETDRTGEPFACEYRMIGKDGRVVWVDEQTTLLRDDLGRPTAWLGVKTDVTERKLAEQRLVDAQERYRALVERVPAVVYIDADDDIATATYMSPQYEQLTGYTVEERLADPELWVRTLHPDDRERVLAESARTSSLDEPFVAEYRLVGKDGRVVWVRDEAALVIAADGARSWQGILLDITDRKAAERRLQEAEARFRTLVETLPSVTYIDAADLDWNTVYISPQLEEILGYTPDEWMTDQRLWDRAIHPDDHARIDAALRSHAATGDPLEVEYRMQTADGRWRWLRDQARIVRGEDGALYSQGLFTDITDRRAAEDLLREAEERFRALVEHIPATLYIETTDPRQASLYASPQIEQLLGVTQEEYTNDPMLWERLLHPDDRAEIVTTYERSLAAGEPWNLEYRVVRPDGAIVWVHDEAELLRDDAGKIRSVQGVMYDVTERRQIEDALKESEQREREAADRLRNLDDMKNTFLAAVSHELRSPLTSILGLALTLERQDQLSDDDRDDLLGRLAANARKLDRLLKDLLDIDRLSRGIVTPQYRLTDLGALVRRTIESLDAVAGRTITVRTEPVLIPVDPAKVERIVENLVANAARHTEDESTIWVRVTSLDGGALLSVEDDGPGVPADLKDVIFEPFRQGPTVSRAQPGTGIGLSLVARFSELHGGRAWVADRAGGGASFNVFLPGTDEDRREPAETGFDQADAG